MKPFNLLCVPQKYIGIQLTSGEQGIRRWWQRAYYADDFDEYWDEPSAMDIEFGLPYGYLGLWLSLRTR